MQATYSTVGQVARVLGVSPDTVRRRADRLKIGTRINGERFFSAQEVEILKEKAGRRFFSENATL
jgi:DNA-binding transcriptional MerR regulator